MTTYTVCDREGYVKGRNLSAIDAADYILCYDGHAYEMRKVSHGYKLFVSRSSQNSVGGLLGFTEAWCDSGQICSRSADEETARTEIAEQVISAGWPGASAIADDVYDKIMAELAAENEAA
jgi:hypothetical protein